METSASPNSERLAKRIAHAGICSRRDAEKLIAAGNVKVNGETIHTPAFNVSASDVVEVDGKPIDKPEKTRLWLYHKPPGLLTTNRDPEGRPTIFSDLPDSMPRVVSVGRLDMNSEGLLLLTNNGGLARMLELPATGLPRNYRIRVFGEPNERKLKWMEDGISINGIRYGSIKAVVTRKSKSNSWLDVNLHEGKNRELRNVFEHLDHQISRLIRISYGPFELGELKPGTITEVSEHALKRALKTYQIDI